MPGDREKWEAPDLEARCYQPIDNWISRQTASGEELRVALERHIEGAILKGDLPMAMALLNRLEIYFDPARSRQLEFEIAIRDVYHKRRSGAGNPSCYLWDYNIPAVNGHIRQYRNRHKGDRCFILGSGPSLDRADLVPLKNEITFGTNLLYRNFKKMGFATTYYTIEDYFLIKNYAEEIAAMTGPVKFIPAYRSGLLPYSHGTIYANVIPDNELYPDFPFFSVDASARIWSAANSVYLCLQLASYMGFTEICLLGVDHFYHFPPSATFIENDMRLNGADKNHFAAGRMGNKERFHTPVLKRSEKAYAKAKMAIERRGGKIYNLTEGSQLEIFEKKRLSGVLSKRRKIPGKAAAKEYDASIVIPAYNAEDTLARAVDSAMNQQCDCEIIIVDDGSTDGTAELAREYADRFDFIKYTCQKNKGLGGARNTGIDMATGRYLTFLDADDTLEPHIIGKACHKIRRENADILLFDYNHLFNGINEQPRLGYYLDLCGFQALREFMRSHSVVAWSRLYRLDFLRKHKLRFPEHLYHEDIAFTIAAYYFAKKTTFLREKGYNWISRPGSITRHLGEKHINSMSAQMDAVKQFLIDQGEYEKLSSLFVFFKYRYAKILLDRIRAVEDNEAYDKLTESFVKFLEKHELDTYENIAIGNAFRENFALDIVRSVFRKPESRPPNLRNEKRVPSFPVPEGEQTFA